MGPLRKYVRELTGKGISHRTAASFVWRAVNNQLNTDADYELFLMLEDQAGFQNTIIRLQKQRDSRIGRVVN